MLKILWKRGEIAPEEQFILLSTIFYYLMLDYYVTRGIRFSLRDKRLFEITKVEITRVDCILMSMLNHDVKLTKVRGFANQRLSIIKISFSTLFYLNKLRMKSHKDLTLYPVPTNIKFLQIVQFYQFSCYIIYLVF